MGATTDEEKLLVFNRSGSIFGYLADDHPYFQLTPGSWQEVEKRYIYRYLLNNAQINIRYPNRPIWGRKDLLTIAAPIDVLTGFGNMAVNIIAELAKRRNDIVLWPLANWWYEYTPESVQALMKKQHLISEYALAITIPPELQFIPSPKIILYSMWECQVIPQGWGDLVNQHCVAMIVPCESQAEIWKAGGVTVPVHVVPLGIDPEVWKYQERPARGDVPFRILTYGMLSSRKSPLETIVEVAWRAFSDVYGKAVDDWELTLKTRRGILGTGLTPLSISDPHIKVLSYDATPQEMVKLCYKADTAIFLSKFEGFGLGPREAMATGLEVILSENSGHLSDCNINFNVPVPTKRTIPAEEAYTNEAWNWSEPDYEFAATALRQSYENWVARGRTQSPLGKRAEILMRTHRTWSETANGVMKVLAGVPR